MTAAAPSGVVTFLFTDVEGSTRRWEADAQTMRAALATHDEVLRSAIEAHGAWLFKHTGDGVCAAFARLRQPGRPGYAEQQPGVAAGAAVAARATEAVCPRFHRYRSGSRCRRRRPRGRRR
jgi:class 3 adenylate cyclase